MRSKRDEVRKRIAARKKARERMEKNQHDRQRLFMADDVEKHGFDQMPSYEVDPGEGSHPLFRKEVWLFKVLASACIVLVAAILFRNQAASLDPARDFVKNTFEADFQFAAVSEWYEEKFGKPLAFFQFPGENPGKKDSIDSPQYALPASGKILENFDVNGERILIETDKGASVEAMTGGMVRFVGEKEGFGKTVIIQHGDKSETWYGNLNEINVKLYDLIEKQQVVGKVNNTKTNEKGAFYFAIKKGDDFIDPIQVIQFE